MVISLQIIIDVCRGWTNHGHIHLLFFWYYTTYVLLSNSSKQFVGVRECVDIVNPEVTNNINALLIKYDNYLKLSPPPTHTVHTHTDQSGNGHHIARPLPTPPQPPIVMNVASGAPQFAPLNVLTDNDYVSDDTLFLLVRLHPWTGTVCTKLN